MSDEQDIAEWQRILRLTDWKIATSPVPCDDADERSTVDIDRNVKRAVLRYDPTLPDDQRERQTLHELLHVRLSGLEDPFRSLEPNEMAKTWWRREEEAAIEALVDAFLPDHPRREYRGGAVWSTARYPQP